GIVGNGANSTAPHSDSRSLLFGVNTGVEFLLETDDGGIYLLNQPENAGGRAWSSKNGNLRISEVYSVAYDRVNQVFFVGAQDNGSIEQVSSGSSSDWRLSKIGGTDDHMGGDGNTQGFGIQAGQPVRYSLGNNFDSFYHREFNASNTLTSSA